MTSDNLNDGKIFVSISLAVSLIGGWQVANWLGSDRAISWQALLDSLPAAAIAIAIWWYFGISRLSTLAISLAGAWPFWWKTLDHLSAGTPDPHTTFLRLSMQLDNAWYATAWAKGLIEALLILILIASFKRHEE